METLKIVYHDPELIRIEKKEKGDWIDLRASEDMEIKAGELAKIPLGVSIQLPDGYEAIVAPRSSTFKNYGIFLCQIALELLMRVSVVIQIFGHSRHMQ